MNRQSTVEVLEIIQAIFLDAARMETDPDDESGLNTRYTVDHEKLMSNIQAALEKSRKPLI